MFLFLAFCYSRLTRNLHDFIIQSDPELKFFPQLIDHFSGGKSTFLQRYHNRSRPVNNGSKIAHAILYISGESDSFGYPSTTSLVGVLAKDLNAPVLAIEHRYFGASFPTNASTENYAKFLNVKQVLADLAYFVNSTRTTPGWETTKWLVVGGSYSGLLSSFAREVYPNVFHAAISSSGVVLATKNYSDFDLQIAVAMGQECAGVARAVRLEIERLWDLGQDSWILKQFGCEGLETPTDFLFVLGDIFTISPQYSQRGALCDPLVDTLRTGADPLMALAKFSREVFIPQFCGGDVVATYSRDYMRNDETKPNMTGARSWQWMTCNEVGYWQISPGRLSIRPKNLTEQWFADQCKDIFGANHSWPDVDLFNRQYNGLKQNATRVFYTTGSQDPWTWTCVTEDSGVPSGCIAHTIVGPEIGHTTDLHAAKPDDSPDLIKTREWERAVIKEWMSLP